MQLTVLRAFCHMDLAFDYFLPALCQSLKKGGALFAKLQVSADSLVPGQVPFSEIRGFYILG